MALNAGALRHYVALQSQSCDSAVGWEDVDRFWAQITYRGGFERTSGGETSAVGNFRVVTYYRNDLDASMRLYDSETGKTYQIVSYGDPDGQGAELEILCVEAQ